MSGIVIFVPQEKMLLDVKHLLEKRDYEIDEVTYVQSSEVVNEAYRVVSNGASIIISRGIHAQLIKNFTQIPVVEITLTGQEIALLIVEAKKRVKKPNPRIGIVGIKNMFCDMTYFGQIFDVELLFFLAERERDFHQVIRRAVEAKPDMIIGGDMACLEAEMSQIPCMFLSSTEDSIQVAIETAIQMKYAQEVEKRNNANIEVLTEYSFNGIVKIDLEGQIIMINPVMEEMLGIKKNTVMQSFVWDILPDTDREKIRNVLLGKREDYSTLIQQNNQNLSITLVPIKVNDTVDGAILYCHRLSGITRIENDKLQEMYLKGYVAKTRFEDLMYHSPQMEEVIGLAKVFSQSNNPVLITGETGTEKDKLAACIHNNSIRKSGPFITVNCGGLSEEEQSKMLFGTDKDHPGALVTGYRGTVFVQEIEELSLHNQVLLYQAIRNKALVKEGAEKITMLDVRLIVSGNEDLGAKMSENMFRQDLFYCLSGLYLYIPPLSERKEDIELYAMHYIKEYMSWYSRFYVLTEEGKKTIRNFNWGGNLIQLESFCERLILTTNQRKLDEQVIRKLLNQMYANRKKKEDYILLEGLQDPRALPIIKALEKHGGNRIKAAEELHISTTTLWRYIKKYGIENKYN
ncbi:sigma 54-interacting transcriptional regulator [Anaerocolumna sp. MB42-C2]|uniref:sigma 54-interacting transcriptional regulator n=1 Tax=Anaerocolumna sp. MB42-C2 TaxID=3070997 RepID=UPI0027DEFD14|nr:sigma 54-interacting transcriptional regulator [Anaerocolumna sp. MB42-C2]WMJ86195.1 sigma 54-interacting transcriptional regulator [Anaerocolumna sp. MB42-C2]